MKPFESKTLKSTTAARAPALFMESSFIHCAAHTFGAQCQTGPKPTPQQQHLHQKTN